MSQGNATGIVVTLNGERRHLSAGVTLLEVVMEGYTSTKGVAAAVNGEVIPKSAWQNEVLQPEDRIEILTIAQGG